MVLIPRSRDVTDEIRSRSQQYSALQPVVILPLSTIQPLEFSPGALSSQVNIAKSVSSVSSTPVVNNVDSTSYFSFSSSIYSPENTAFGFQPSEATPTSLHQVSFLASAQEGHLVQLTVPPQVSFSSLRCITLTTDSIQVN